MTKVYEMRGFGVACLCLQGLCCAFYEITGSQILMAEDTIVLK